MVGPFSAAGAGARIQVGKGMKGKTRGVTQRKDARAGPARRAVRVCLRAGLQLEERTGGGGAFLFPGDIYLGVGGRRGPRFA